MNLSTISSARIHQKLLSLRQTEREVLSEIMWHLREIDDRKLFADHKCSSLFDYCVSVLKYSEGQASRRVTACRLLKKLPAIAEKVEAGEINLTQIGQLDRHFKEEKITDDKEKEKILNQIVGQTTRASETTLSGMKTEPVEKRFNLSIKEATHDGLRMLQNLKAHSCPDMDSLLVKMSDDIGKIWDPSVVRRGSKILVSETRYIPSQLRSMVWARDGGRCTNCSSNRMIEYDHIKPFALGGKTSFENLRLLCRNCNQRANIKIFGKEKVLAVVNDRQERARAKL